MKRQKKKSKWIYWVCGIFLCIVLLPIDSGIIGLVPGIMISKWLISVARKSNEPQRYLERRRKELEMDRQQRLVQQAIREQLRSATRAELEELKRQAYWWDGEARKTGSAADAIKAQDFWNEVNSMQRKLDSI